MVVSRFTISFVYQLDNSKLTVPITADVEIHGPETYFAIKNVRPQGEYSRSVAPDIVINKRAGKWVHRDSQQESHFSTQAGETIDAHRAAIDSEVPVLPKSHP